MTERTGRGVGKQKNRPTYDRIVRQTDNRLLERQIDGQTCKPMDREIGGQMDRQTETFI
jgi:hypothetical protein